MSWEKRLKQRARQRLSTVALFCLALSARSVAAAEPGRPHNDGVYGRLAGDLDFGLGLGTKLHAGQLSALARVTAHYFGTAGLYLTYSDALRARATGLEERRALGFGVDLRPLFLPRWLLNLQRGPSLLDLTLDSLSLSMGVTFNQPFERGFGAERGFETSLGFGVPLLLRARGPWLEVRGVGTFPDQSEFRPSVFALLSFHGLFVTPLVAEAD